MLVKHCLKFNQMCNITMWNRTLNAVLYILNLSSLTDLFWPYRELPEEILNIAEISCSCTFPVSTEETFIYDVTGLYTGCVFKSYCEECQNCLLIPFNVVSAVSFPTRISGD